MHQRKSKFSANRADRPRLAPHWLVLLLAMLVGGTLLLLYPRQDLERRLTTDTEQSDLSTSYLNNLLRSDPNNQQLRQLLSERQEAARLAKAAAEAAAKAIPPAIPQTEWTQWVSQVNAYRNLDSSERTPQNPTIRTLRAHTQHMGKLETRPDLLMQLAQVALELGDEPTNIEIYQRLVTQATSPAEAAASYASAARTAIGQSRYQLAADFYRKSQVTATDPAQAKASYLAAISALQSGNHTAAALQFAQDHLEPFAKDPEVLQRVVEIARAAGQPQIAARYMRILLKIALQQQWQAYQLALADQASSTPDATDTEPNDPPQARMMAWSPRTNATTTSGFIRTAATTEPAEPSSKKGPQLAFDNKTYVLGYEVFLESGNLDDAWLVAQAAVRQAPRDMAWRERFAKVSEWTQRIPQALEQWWALARATQRDDAWQAVLRLAPGLFADEALMDALRYQLGKTPDDLKLIKAYVDASERMAQPEVALQWLTQRQQRPEILLMQARLAQRSGQPELALKSWGQLLSNPDWNTTEYALEAATLALTQRQGALGLHWLENAQPLEQSNTASQADYWRLTAQVAELRQRQTLAIQAYQNLIVEGKGTINDFNGLIRTLQPTQPLQAADVAVMAWKQHQQPTHLLQALNLYISRNQWVSMGVVIQEVTQARQAGQSSPAIDTLFRTAEFLRLAGTYHQNQGNFAQARKYYESGLSVAGQSNEMRQALLWLYIDGNDTVALRQILGQYEPEWSQDEAMHNSLASSYQALSQPQVALHRYLRPHLAEHRDDFLWMMNYADALDQNQETDAAWRMRRYLLSTEWQQARAAQPSTPTGRTAARTRWLSAEGLDTTQRIARTRLLLTQRPGDPGLEALRELLRLDRDADKNYSNAAAETAIGWLQDAGEYTAERGFLWHQYARTLSLRSNRPLWADITVALAEKDVAATGQLLSQFDERLPRYDRVQAASAVYDIRLAQSAAFETQEQQPDDDPLHLNLTESLLAMSDNGTLSVVRRVLDGINETESAAKLHLAISPRLSVELRIDRVARLVNNPLIVRNPSSEQGLDAAFLWKDHRTTAGLHVGHRQSLATYNPIALAYEYRWDPRLALLLSAGWHMSTQESLVLRMAGMRNNATIGLRYQPTARDQFTLEQSSDHYQLQTGAVVGTGQHTSLNYLHSYRIGSPGLDFGAFWSRHSYSKRDTSALTGADRDALRYLPNPNDAGGPDYFLPRDFQFYGIQLQSNLRFDEEYTRKLQPFASVARTWHSEQGPGYSLQMGLAGSVWGADHLSIRGGITKSSATSRGLNRELQVLYRIYD